MRRKIRLTESDLHRIINNSVKRIIKEYYQGNSSEGIRHNNYGERENNIGGAFGYSALDDAKEGVDEWEARRRRLEDEDLKRRRGW